MLEIDIEGEGGSLRVAMGCEQVPASMRRVGSPSLYSLILGNDSHEVVVEKREDEYLIRVAGELMAVKVQDERARWLAAVMVKSFSKEKEMAIRAPMPGLVASISVSPGMVVEEGKPLLVLEAMKMLNELRAPQSGVVKSVNVEQGDTVEDGQVLVLLS